MNKPHVSRIALGFAALGLMAAPSFAQEASEDEVAEDRERTLGEIIVTAQRTESLLSETPVAVSAISGDDLVSLNVTDPTTLGNFVPNLSIDRGAQNGLQITIRGVSSNDSTEKGDPSAAFLVDGIVIARQQAQDVAFFDLERVEVLRGPQGTLFGRNSTAGLVHLITARPKDEFEGSVNVAYGNFDTIQATGVINIPITESLAVRAAVNYDRRDNFLIDGADDGFTLDPFRDVLSFRLSTKWDITDGIDLTIIGDYTSMDGVASDDLLLTNFFPTANIFNPALPVFAPGTDVEAAPGGPEERRTLAIPQLDQPFRDNETYGVAGELNIDLGPGTITYLGSYREFLRDELETAILGLVSVSTVADYTQQSHELRYAFDVGNLQAQAGVYYFDEQSSIDVTVGNASAFVPDVEVAPGFFIPVSVFGVAQDPTNAESIAVFGQATYGFTDNFRLTGGLRFTNDEKSREGVSFIELTGIPGEIPVTINDAAVEFNEVTWRVGLEYDTPLGLAFATISRGYKAGGFNDGCEIGTQPACTQPADLLFYDEESLISYEIGAKLSFLENRLRLNATGFYYDYEDLQLSSVFPINTVPTILIQNVPEAEVLGLELDALINPLENHQIDLALTLLTSEFGDFFPVEFIDPTINFNGRDLDRSPNVTFSAGYSYTQPLPWGGDLVGRVRTKFSDNFSITDFGAAVGFIQPSFTRTDLSLTYNSPDSRYNVQLFANNLENNNILTNATTALTGALQVSAPRTYGIRVGANF